jgi:hypothetical protein
MAKKIAKVAMLGMMSVGLMLSFRSVAQASNLCDSGCNDIGCAAQYPGRSCSIAVGEKDGGCDCNINP